MESSLDKSARMASTASHLEAATSPGSQATGTLETGSPRRRSS
jgi:hypothetical protein